MIPHQGLPHFFGEGVGVFPADPEEKCGGFQRHFGVDHIERMDPGFRRGVADPVFVKRLVIDASGVQKQAAFSAIPAQLEVSAPASPVSGTTNGMMDYLAEHLIEEVRVSDLARAFSCSENYVIRLFRRWRGITPYRPIREMQLKSGVFAGNHRPRCSESCRPMRPPESVRLLPGVPPGKRGVSGGVAEKAERLRPGFLQNKNDFAKKSRIHTKNDRFVQIGMLDGFLKIVIP